MTAAVAILVPVLGRPHRVRVLLESIAAATPPPYRVLFIVDPTDTRERAAVLAAGGELLLYAGSYATKINAGIAATDEPLLFLAADDLHFHPGWLRAAAALIDTRVGVVGTNDLGNRRVLEGSHATHSLVARWYVQLGQVDGAPGLLHEGYAHNFVDDELVATAKHRGAFRFARDSVVEHLHPHWGKGDVDATYRRGQRTFARDRHHHRARSQLWT